MGFVQNAPQKDALFVLTKLPALNVTKDFTCLIPNAKCVQDFVIHAQVTALAHN